MPKKPSINTLIDRYNANLTADHQGWIGEMKAGSDRVAAIVGATLLDEQLRDLLLAFFVDERTLGKNEAQPWARLFGPDGALGPAASRSTLALALGLIPKDLYDDLQIVRRVRNVFAHGLHGLNFQHPEVAGACHELKIVRDALPQEWHPDLTPRMTYILTVVITAIELDQRTSLGPPRREVPDNTLYRMRWDVERLPGKAPMAIPFRGLDPGAPSSEG